MRISPSSSILTSRTRYSVRLTVGPGITPDQPFGSRAADLEVLHRRWGISPRPEDLQDMILHFRRLCQRKFASFGTTEGVIPKERSDREASPEGERDLAVGSLVLEPEIPRPRCRPRDDRVHAQDANSFCHPEERSDREASPEGEKDLAVGFGARTRDPSAMVPASG